MILGRKNYRIVSLILVIVFSLASVLSLTPYGTSAQGTQVFSDVPESHWAYPYISSLSSLGIVKGLNDGSFGVNLSASRAEFATFMVRTLKIDTNISYSSIFNDVNEDAWYALNVEAAYKANLIKGTGNGLFEPEADITREQVTTILSNAIAEYENSTVEELAKGCELSAPDAAEVSDWAVNGLKVCYKYKVINGYEDGSFKPKNQINRAEAAKVISIFNDSINPSQTGTPSPTTTPVMTPTNEPAATPELPRVYLDTTYHEPSGNIIKVNEGDNLQQAINNANPGDTLELQAGATFYGNFTLPDKLGNGWITIRSSAYSSLPAPENRVSPADAVNMPKIVTKTTENAIRTDLFAHNYRLIGLEVTTYDAATDTTVEGYDLIAFGDGSSAQSTLDVVAHDLIIDRCYLHGHADTNLKRAVALNSASTAVIDSYVSDCHTDYPDSQGLLGWNGPGPFKIVNNYIEGGSENIMFGGADTNIPNMTPSDIEVRDNYLFKPLSWKADDQTFGGYAWNVKNIFELKHANRVLVEGNVLENNWVGADQLGYAIVLTPRNGDLNPWCSVRDVTIKNNLIKNSPRAVMVMGVNDATPSLESQRINISNNVFDLNIQKDGQAIDLNNGGTDIVFDHNDFLQDQYLFFVHNPVKRFVFTNNLTQSKYDGLISNTLRGDQLLDTYFTSVEFRKNILAGTRSTKFVKYSDNFFTGQVPTLNDIGFIDLANDNYKLAVTSPFKNAGTDGKDIGADIDELNAAIANTISGNSSN